MKTAKRYIYKARLEDSRYPWPVWGEADDIEGAKRSVRAKLRRERLSAGEKDRIARTVVLEDNPAWVANNDTKSSDGKALLDKLYNETAPLKETYVEKMGEWAGNYYDGIRKEVDAGYAAYVDKNGYDEYEKIKTAEMTTNEYFRYYSNPLSKWRYNELSDAEKATYKVRRRLSHRNASRWTRINKEADNTKAEFIELKKEEANQYYESTVLKLATRIREIGFNIDNLTLKSSHVDVNFETWISDGEKTYQAFTIIASGPVQRPHYRYLINERK